MKRLPRALVIILPLLATPALAGQNACVEWVPVHPDHFSADPTTLAAAWLPDIERLYEAIPFLSPKEERWLKEELGSVRAARATGTLEFALREAKLRAGAELALVRRLTEELDGSAQARDWLWLAHSLVEADAAIYLARLEAEGVIQRDAIHFHWKFLAGAESGATLQEAIRWGRARLARHVLGCTLPSVLGISMEPWPWRTNPALRARWRHGSPTPFWRT